MDLGYPKNTVPSLKVHGFLKITVFSLLPILISSTIFPLECLALPTLTPLVMCSLVCLPSSHILNVWLFQSHRVSEKHIPWGLLSHSPQDPPLPRPVATFYSSPVLNLLFTPSHDTIFSGKAHSGSIIGDDTI